MVATCPAAHPEIGAPLGSRAIITGAVRGVGRAIVERFTAEGSAVAGQDRAEIAGGVAFVVDLADRSPFVTGTDQVIDGALGFG